MNQILFNKKINRKKKYIFKVQLILSIIVAMVLILSIFIEYNNDENLENISKVIDLNMRIKWYI